MATTSIIVNSTDTSGKSAQKAMTCVNPDATNAQLAALGQMITAASNNTYVETFRINKINCDLESDAPAKPTPTLTATVTNYSLASFESDNGEMIGSTCNLTYNGDGDIFIGTAPIAVGLRFKVFKNGASIAVKPFYLGSAPTLTETVTFKVGFTETANYKACSVEITITA